MRMLTRTKRTSREPRVCRDVLNEVCSFFSAGAGFSAPTLKNVPFERRRGSLKRRRNEREELVA
jgi:hypothetical protein